MRLIHFILGGQDITTNEENSDYHLTAKNSDIHSTAKNPDSHSTVENSLILQPKI